MTYACRTCDTTFTAPTDTDTVRCPGCGDMVEQQPAASPPPDQTLRDRIAEAVQHGPTWMLPRSLAEEVADAVLAVLPPPADRAAVLREAADRYAQLVDENEAYDREHGQLDETARVQHGAVRDVVVGLRRLAAEAPQPEAPWATDSARIGRVLIWSHAEVGHSDFGQGYRTAQEDVRAILTRPLLGAEAPQPDTETQAEEIRLLRLTLDAVEESRRELRSDIARLRSQMWTLAAIFEGFGRLLATSSRDWGQYAPDAWLYAIICGWDCEEPVHDETCTHGAMEEMAERHGWDAATVAKARRYRAVVHTLTAAAGPGRAADTHHDEEGGRG